MLSLVYLMNGKEKLYLIFIRNDIQMVVYMLDVRTDSSMPFLRINVVKEKLRHHP